MHEDTHFAVGNKFPPLKRARPRISRGILRKGKNPMTINKFLQNLSNILQTSLPDALYFIRVNVSSFNKKDLKILADRVNDIMSDSPHLTQFSQWYSVVLDLIDSKLYKPKPSKAKKPIPSNVCHVFFDNKAIEKINLSKILNSIIKI